MSYRFFSSIILLCLFTHSCTKSPERLDWRTERQVINTFNVPVNFHVILPQKDTAEFVIRANDTLKFYGSCSDSGDGTYCASDFFPSSNLEIEQEEGRLSFSNDKQAIYAPWVCDSVNKNIALSLQATITTINQGVVCGYTYNNISAEGNYVYRYYIDSTDYKWAK